MHAQTEQETTPDSLGENAEQNGPFLNEREFQLDPEQWPTPDEADKDAEARQRTLNPPPRANEDTLRTPDRTTRRNLNEDFNGTHRYLATTPHSPGHPNFDELNAIRYSQQPNLGLTLHDQLALNMPPHMSTTHYPHLANHAPYDHPTHYQDHHMAPNPQFFQQTFLPQQYQFIPQQQHPPQTQDQWPHGHPQHPGQPTYNHPHPTQVTQLNRPPTHTHHHTQPTSQQHQTQGNATHQIHDKTSKETNIQPPQTNQQPPLFTIRDIPQNSPPNMIPLAPTHTKHIPNSHQQTSPTEPQTLAFIRESHPITKNPPLS